MNPEPSNIQRRRELTIFDMVWFVAAYAVMYPVASAFDLCVMIPCWRCQTVKKYMETMIQSITGESQTLFLCGLGLLSLVLPLLMSFRGPRDAASKRSCMKTVWTGTTLLTIALLTVRVSASVAPYAAIFGLVSTVACTLVLLRQFRDARLHETSAA